jgi:phosphate transport system substrate-binding protein
LTDPSQHLQQRRNLLLLAGVAASGQAVAALNFWPFDRRTSRRPLLIAGANAMFSLNQALAQAFSKLQPDTDVVVESGGSLSALIALKRGSVDIAAMDRDLKASEEEAGLKSYLVARNGVGIVVHPDCKLLSLQATQVRALLAGEVSNWAQVGGPHAAVQVVSRTRGSTGRQFVEDVILAGGDVSATALQCDSAAKLVETVAATPYAIGFVSLKDKIGTLAVTHLQVDGVEARRETLLSGRYPYTQSLYLVTLADQKTAAPDFVDFVRSKDGQAIVDAANLVGTY